MFDDLHLQSQQRQIDNLIQEVIDMKHVLEKALMGLNAAAQQLDRASQLHEMQKELEYLEKRNNQ